MSHLQSRFSVSAVSRDELSQVRVHTCVDIGSEFSLEGLNNSVTTISRILKIAGYDKPKPIRKSRLTKKMRAKRLP
jgi:hypothetical protein